MSSLLICAKRDQKLHKRAVNSVEPAVPRYLCWSEQPIIWSRGDHPPQVDNPGHLALVVAPQVGGYKFTKVLMDGGAVSISCTMKLSGVWG